MPASAYSRTLLFLSSVFASLVFCAHPLSAEDEAGYTFRSSANEVRITFAASGRDGHAVKTLRSTDVAVADNGAIIRHLRSFRSTSDSPLDLVLLLDASDSVASQLPQEIGRGSELCGEHAVGGTRPRFDPVFWWINAWWVNAWRTHAAVDLRPQLPRTTGSVKVECLARQWCNPAL